MRVGLYNTYASYFQLKEKAQAEDEEFESGESINSAYSDLKYIINFKSSDAKQFLILFYLTISTQEYDIVTEFNAIFDCDEDITKEFMHSPFPKVNAPAIAYPFLRSYINTLTVNSGYKPTILSALNFTVFNDFFIQLDGERLSIESPTI